MIDHDELASAIPALVLRTLSGEERRQVLLHMEGCESCRRLAARMARGVDALALEPDPVEPPARLRGRVLAAVSAEVQDAPEPTRRRPLSRVPGRPRLRLGGAARRLAVAAMVAAALVVGIGIGHGLSPGPTLVTAPPGEAHYPLHGTGTMAGASGSVVVLTHEDLALVNFKGLPPLAANQVYELWTVTPDGKAQPAGVFVPDAQGPTAVAVTQSLRGVKTLAVTVEPGPNGSAQPSQQPQLAATIA